MNRTVADIGTDHAHLQRARLQNFLVLSHPQQLRAIHELARQGLTDRDISAATSWGIDMVRNALSQQVQR